MDDIFTAAAKIQAVVECIPTDIANASLRSRVDGIRSAILENPDQMLTRGMKDMETILRDVPPDRPWKRKAMSAFSKTPTPQERSVTPNPRVPPPPVYLQPQELPTQEGEAPIPTGPLPAPTVAVKRIAREKVYAWLTPPGKVIVINGSGAALLNETTALEGTDLIIDLMGKVGDSRELIWVDNPLSQPEVVAILNKGKKPPAAAQEGEPEYSPPQPPEAMALDSMTTEFPPSTFQAHLMNKLREVKRLKGEFKEISKRYRAAIKTAEKELYACDSEKSFVEDAQMKLNV